MNRQRKLYIWVVILLLNGLFSGQIVQAQSNRAPDAGPIPATFLQPAAEATDCSAVTEIPASECQALLALYNSTNGPDWTDNASNGWNKNNTPCRWAGITCADGHVSGIYRVQQDLTGSLPDLSALTQLKQLILPGNQLRGNLPDLNALRNLQELILSNNQLSGFIPDLSGLISLNRLFLAGNELFGPIPDLSALVNLQEMVLSSNWLSGSIPDLNALAALRVIHLSNNFLSGSIPDLSALTQLSYLDLSDNRLSGPIPDLSALGNLSLLFLRDNLLSGPVPDLSASPGLQALHLGNNRLTGPLPDLSSLVNLSTLNLSDNELSGPIPNLSASTRLEELNLAYNEFCGIIPTSLMQLSQLKRLDLRVNHLSASDPALIAWLDRMNRGWAATQIPQPCTDCNAVTEIPVAECRALTALYYNTDGAHWSDSPGSGWNQTNTPCSWTGVACSYGHVMLVLRSVKEMKGPLPDLNALTELQYLYLNNNQLSGTLSNLSGLSRLRYLYLGNNDLSGPIPALTHWPDLQDIGLENNRFSGPVPDLSSSSQLQGLCLTGNSLSGSIPDLSSASSLVKLCLGRNQLTGTIPNLNSVPTLQYFDAGDNYLSGPFPEVGELDQLVMLSMYRNHLCGSIPSNLRGLPALRVLHLHYNHLSTSDPELIAWLDQISPGWSLTQSPQDCLLQPAPAVLPERDPQDQRDPGRVDLIDLPSELSTIPSLTLSEPGLKARTDRSYRFVWFSEDALEIVLEVPNREDADLYLWQPFNFGVPERIAAAPGSDRIVIPAPTMGEYILMVRGVSTSLKSYRLTFAHGNGAELFSAVSIGGQNKPELDPPQIRPLIDELLSPEWTLTPF